MVADRLKTVVRRTNPGMLSVIVLGAFIFEASAAEYALDRVVLVSRHGVRAPTDSPAIAEFSRSLSWPKWPVKDAFLTQRGKLLATRMGEFYAAEYGSQGLLPAGHLNEKQVYVWADVDQRTRETGAGLLEGIFGCQDGCPLPGNDYGDNDALFHPVKGKVCNIDPATAQAEIIKQAGGSLDKALEPYRDAILPELQKVLDCCQPKICKPLSSCTLDTMQSLLEGVSLKGPIAVGSTASEVFLLEYGQGMQAKDVMWGHGSSARINAFLGLHDLQFKLLQRTRYIAKRQGAALGRQILETLRETAEKKSVPLRPVPRDAKLVIYVGHDTNLANIGGMLDVDWSFASGLGDKTPPAGAMAFELFNEKGTVNYFVRMTYYNQTLEQMRNATPLSPPAAPDAARANRPEVTRITPKCTNVQDGMCPWRDFDTWMRGAIENDCASLQAKPD